MKRKNQVSRRVFLKQFCTGSITALAMPNLRVFGQTTANSKLNVAFIGCGGRSRQLLAAVFQENENIIAMCDVNSLQILKLKDEFVKNDPNASVALKKIKVYEDYRKLLDSEKSLDAVVIAIGSRWHVPMASIFMKAGKHVYCEKPLAYSIAEAREIIELTPKCKVVTQTGTHGGSGKSFRRSIEIIQAGILGQIREVYMWCNGKKNCYARNVPSHDRPPGEDPVPEGFNWDFWLGPVPYRPFKKNTYHGGCIQTQNWLDLCNGMLAGFGAHTFYLPVRALKLDYPIRVEANIPEPVKETYVSAGKFRYDFAARGNMAPVTLWWMDFANHPPEEVIRNLKERSAGEVPDKGCLFVGDKGELFTGGFGEQGIMKLKEDKQWRGVLDHELAKSVPVTLPRTPEDNHMLEWLKACKNGPATFSGFDVGGNVSEVYLPGIISLKLGRPIEWDGPNMKVKGVPEAEPFILRPPRKKWLM